MREGATFLVLLLICMNVFEAVTAASVHKDGAIHASVSINPVTRFMMHLMMGLVGAFCAVYSTKVVLDLIKSFSKEVFSKKPIAWVLLTIQLCLFVPLSFILPYINVYLISISTEETQLFEIAFKQWFYFWKSNAELGIIGGDENFNALARMSPTMAVSFCSLFVHFFVSFLDSFVAVYDRYMYGLDADEMRQKMAGYKGKNVDVGTGNAGKNADAKSDNSGNADANKDNAKTHLPNVKKILQFLDISNDLVNTYQKKIEDTVADNANTQHVNSMLANINETAKQIEDFNKIVDVTTKNRRRNEIRDDIKNFMRASTEEGGFGIDIPSKK
jgi:hypothetical protein